MPSTIKPPFSGYILGSVDDILQVLDDNSMNLQSMTASRFVGPFLESVNKWEKSLSHISEVVEVAFTNTFICLCELRKVSKEPCTFYLSSFYQH